MSRRITLTLSEDEYELLQSAAKYYQHPVATVAGDMLAQHLNDWEDCMEGEAAMQVALLMNCPPAGNA